MKIFLLLLILVSVPSVVFAIELVEGELDGKIKFNKQTKFDQTTFVVRAKIIDDEPTYKIEMIHDERLYKFKNLRLDAMPEKILFNLDTGKEYSCELFLDEEIKGEIADCQEKDGYCGKCVVAGDTENQKLIIINMQSPIKEPEASNDEDESDETDN